MRVQGRLQRGIAIIFSILLLMSTATAQEAAPDDPRARKFFEIGAQAYRKGEYLLAIEAFEQAYNIVKRPGLLFSLGQAHQRQFRASGKPAHLESAIANYRRYLAEDKSGAPHGSALSALSSLLPIAEQLRAQAGDSRAAPKLFGRLLLSSSTPGAVMTVSGELVPSLPAALELPTDQYTVEASAEGYVSQKIQVPLTAGSVVPVSLDLLPKPAFVLISGPPGAEAYVDGRPVGFLPLPALSVTAGSHWISLRQFGRKTRTASVIVKRGATASVRLELATTAQRKAAYGFAAGSLAALAVSGVAVGLASASDNEAEALDSKRKRMTLDSNEVNQLNAEVRARDRYGAFAIGSAVAAAGLLGVGLVLYFSDSPDPPGRDSASLARRRFLRLEPLVAPGLLGTGLAGSF